MTIKEFEEKLRSLSNDELKNFNDDLGGGQKNIEDRMREFVDNPQHERRICQLLGLKTEEEKLTEASIASSRAASESASSARWSVIISILAFLVSITGLVLYICSTLIQYDDLKATILGVNPSSIDSKLFTVDIVFTNNGNQQCSIAVVNLIEKNIDNTDPANPPKGEIIIPFSNQSSFTINSKEIISKHLMINGNGKDQITDSGFTFNKNREWQLCFSVIDSKGKYYVIREPVFWNTFVKNQLKVKNYPFVVKLLPSSSVNMESLSLPLMHSANQ